MGKTDLASLERNVLADLVLVRRLARPWRRCAAVNVVAALTAVAIVATFGVRADAAALGPGLLWGLSAFQACYGLTLVALALREAVPGRHVGSRIAGLLLLAGGCTMLAVTGLTWLAHPSHVPAGRETVYWTVCLVRPTLAGLPVLIVALLLAFRAYPTRPALTGALAGLGSGLLVDGIWRVYCEVSDPAHVLGSHAVAVVLLTACGVALAMAGRAVQGRLSRPPR